MYLLRIITPEEISEIATKHNGGKFLSLTDLAVERFAHNISRDFSEVASVVEAGEVENSEAKILPFKIEEKVSEEAQAEILTAPELDVPSVKRQHGDNENMATFILIEKERLKKSQQSLKQKEIIDLYKKNSTVAVEQIKHSNLDVTSGDDAGILVNKKHY
jgi:hypothetical protein